MILRTRIYDILNKKYKRNDTKLGHIKQYHNIFSFSKRYSIINLIEVEIISRLKHKL